MYPDVLNNQAKKIFGKLKSFSSFYLAGGTALALQINHRISVDFDLFCCQEIPTTLLDKVKRVFEDYKIDVLINDSENLTVLIDKVKTTFFNYPFEVIAGYKEYQGIKLLTIPEIGAFKAYALGRRATYKDYVDLYFILIKKYSSLAEIIKIAEKKYKDEFNLRLFFEQLVYLKDVTDVDIKFIGKEISKKEIQDFFQKLIRTIKI